MKTKLFIFVLLITSLCWVMPTVSMRAADNDNLDMPILSKELPSYSNLQLQREKRSVAGVQSLNATSNPLKGTGRAFWTWSDPEMPGQGGTGPGNVGAPIGDVTLPVVFLALFIYLLYRGATTTKRRNNF